MAAIGGVEPPRGNRPRLAVTSNHSSHARFVGQVGKRAIAIVVQQLVTVHAGNVQIDKSIVVIIPSSDSHGIPNAFHSRLLGHIRKGTIAIVAIKAVPVARVGLLKRRNGCAIGKENVQQAVVVVVKHRNPAQHRFDRVALGGNAVLKLKSDTGTFDQIFERNPALRCRIRFLDSFSGRFGLRPATARR